MWSLGCVLIEAAVWVCFGRRGRLKFQQRRRDENNDVAPGQRDLGRSDCFHNGKARLKTVEEVFDLVQRDGRRSDELTPRIVRLVLDHLLVDENSRYEARLLSSELGNMIRTTTDWPHDRLSRGISTASSASCSHRSQEFRHSQHDGIDDPQNMSSRPQYRIHTPSTTIDSIEQYQTPPAERVSTMGLLPRRSTSFRSQNSPAEPWNHNEGNQGLQRMESGQLPIPLPERNGRHSTYSAISPMEGFHPDTPTHAPTETIRPDHTQRQIGHVRSPDQPWPAQGVATSLTNSSHTTITHSQPRDYKRTTFPDISMEDVTARRARGKPPKLRPLLQGEDQAMMFLKKRDHVSLRTRFGRGTPGHGQENIY